MYIRNNNRITLDLLSVSFVFEMYVHFSCFFLACISMFLVGAESASWDEADWGWREDEEELEKGGQDNGKPEKENSFSWLQECCVSVSPTADFMAIAHGEKLVILSRM